MILRRISSASALVNWIPCADASVSAGRRPYISHSTGRNVSAGRNGINSFLPGNCTTVLVQGAAVVFGGIARKNMICAAWEYHLFRQRDEHFRKFLSTSASLFRKRDILAQEKLQVADYGEVQKTRKRFYVFGSTTEGALGLSNLLKPKSRMKSVYEFLHHPIRNSFGGLRDVRDIEAGHGFTLLRARPEKDQLTIFGTGLNTHSQLGYCAVRAGAPLKMLIRLAPVQLPPSLGRIIAMGCGRAHSVFSIEGGGLLTLGDNSNGQCGRLPIPDEEYFGSRFIYRIPRFGSTPDDDVVSVASKFDITLCLTRGGKIYSFGANHKGQLGQGHRIFKHWEPNAVEGDLKGESVVKLTTSGNSVLAITSSGDLFAWGSNESGEVNPEDPGKIFYEPRHVPLKSKIGKVKDASTGGNFTHIVTVTGDVYTWGFGTCLGLGPSTVRVKKPSLMPPPLFGRNDFSPDVAVEHIFAGFFHMAAVNSEGHLYTWGLNESGCLGLGLDREAEQFFPLRVSLAGFAEKVSIGVNHTVVLCKGGI